MSQIVFSRVDHRLIHGQVITKWVKIAQANGIVIVDDYLGQDAFMLDIYRMSAPVGIKIDIVTAEAAGEKFTNGTFDADKTMLLFKNLEMVRKAFDYGVKIPTLQLGGIPHEAGRVTIIPAISLNQKDVEVLTYLNEHQVVINAQVVPEEAEMKYEAIIKKFNN